MKKLISLLLLLALALGLFGCNWNFETEKDISEYGAVHKYVFYDSDEIFNKKYSVSDGIYRVGSVADADGLTNTDQLIVGGKPIEKKLMEYDESFFKDKILLILPFVASDSSCDFEFVGIDFDGTSLTVVIDEKNYAGAALQVISYIYFVIELPHIMAQSFYSYELKRI